MKKRTTLYLNEQFHKDLKDICYREGVAMGSKVEELCGPYVETHKTGNPQTMLDFAGLPRTVPRFRSCVDSNRELHGGEFWCNNSRWWSAQGWRIPEACDRCKGYKEATL